METFTALINVFKAHDVQTKIESDKLYVLDEWYSNDNKLHTGWIDASGFTMEKARIFLGY